MANQHSQTNASGQSIARQSGFGTLGGSPEWRRLQPTDIQGVTPALERAEHDIITPDNQYEAGSVVGLTASPQIKVGATVEAIDFFVPDAMHTRWTGPAALVDSATRPTAATSTLYTVPTMAAALPAGTLVYVSGCAVATNNGLKHVASGGTTTQIPITGGLTAETFTASQNVTIEVCGYQFASGDATITVSGGVATFGTTTKDLTELGLVNGQAVYIGETSAAAYQFATAANLGPAILTSTPTATAFTFAQQFGATATDAGTSKTIRLLFGRTARVVARTSADSVDRYYQIETSVENLGTSNATGYFYTEDCAIDSLTLAMPTGALATLDVALKATDSTFTETQATNADSPTRAVKTTAFNTTSDVAGRVFLSSGGTAITGYIASGSIMIENSAQDNGAWGVLGAAAITSGKVRVKIELQAWLTESGFITAGRNNAEVNAYVWLRNGDAAYCFHVPSARLQVNDASFPKGQIVTIGGELMANRDTTHSTSLIVSKVPGAPALPTLA